MNRAYLITEIYQSLNNITSIGFPANKERREELLENSLAQVISMALNAQKCFVELIDGVKP